MSQSNETVKLYNGASKTEFSKLSFEDQKSLFYQFNRYAVRREIAEHNIALSSIFKDKGDYSSYFNAFNSAFIGVTNMIDLLNDGEYDILPDLSNASFEDRLNNATFNRQIALICYSMRNNERIPNRVDYPVLIAYANMQTRALDKYRRGMSLIDAIYEAGEETRQEFVRKNGCEMTHVVKKYPNGETYLDYRNVTPRVGYSGTLAVGQKKAYENYVNSIISDLFDENSTEKTMSKALSVLVEKVCKRHADDPQFTKAALIEEVVYRYLMPTNLMREAFKNKVNSLGASVNYRVNSSINSATENYSKDSNLSSLKNLEGFRNDSYREKLYMNGLKEIVENMLRDGVGLPLTASKSSEKKTDESGEDPSGFGK